MSLEPRDDWWNDNRITYGLDRLEKFEVDEAMRIMQATEAKSRKVTWLGCYIDGPCQSENSGWTRELVYKLGDEAGFRFLPIYVGQQRPPTKHCTDREFAVSLGHEHGADAARLMAKWGWGPLKGIPVCLDVEYYTYPPEEEEKEGWGAEEKAKVFEYVLGWVVAVRSIGYVPVVYSNKFLLDALSAQPVGVKPDYVWLANLEIDEFNDDFPEDHYPDPSDWPDGVFPPGGLKGVLPPGGVLPDGRLNPNLLPCNPEHLPQWQYKMHWQFKMHARNSLLGLSEYGTDCDSSTARMPLAPKPRAPEPEPGLPAPPPRYPRVQMAFVIDTTGSMGDDLDGVKEAAERIVHAILPYNTEVAVVDYRDFPRDPYGDAGDYPYNDVIPFATGEESLIWAIQSLRLGSGGDTPESVYSALMHTIEGSSLGGWEAAGLGKFIIVMGDAPPHDPEPFTNYTLASVVQAAGGVPPAVPLAVSGSAGLTAQAPSSEANKIVIYSVLVGRDGEARNYFQALASGTGGKLFTAATAADVPAAILGAIGDIEEQLAGTVVVRHAPEITGNSRVEGSLRQLAGENVALGGRVMVRGDFFLPGSPEVRVSGNPIFGGILQGSGSAAPSGYTATVRGNAELSHFVTRSDPIPMPSHAPPSPPLGNRDITVRRPDTSLGDFATLRNLTLLGGAGEVSVPPGTYGRFAAQGDSVLVFGVPDTTQPTVYNLQGLKLGVRGALSLLGPVVLNVTADVTLNGETRAGTNPRWLRINVASGGVTMSGSSELHGMVQAPTGTVTLRGNTLLQGAVFADRLIVSGNALIQQLPPQEHSPTTVAETDS